MAGAKLSNWTLFLKDQIIIPLRCESPGHSPSQLSPVSDVEIEGLVAMRLRKCHPDPGNG